MAKTKTGKKRVVGKKAGVSPASVKDTGYDPSKDRRALASLVARHGKPSDAERDAFDALADDADRALLGGETKAQGVLRDAVAWAVEIDRAYAEHPALVEGHYARARFAYFLDRAAALDAAVSRQLGRREEQGAGRTTAAEREASARSARDALLARLRGFAGKRREERAALAAAAGRTEDATALGASILRLAELAKSWLARGDGASKIQRDAAGLRHELVSAALAAAEGLTGAAAEATLAGRRRGKDAPEVNVLEGGVLVEMEEAARCFDEARRESPLVPSLVPGPATRHVLGTRKKAAAEEEAAPEPTPAS